MIRVLEDRVVNKIAAGEVVERPASVVKELVENALDAGARVLRVDLRSGGRNLVQVADDGAGMDRADATLCIERHATSKIRSDEDLFAIGTLGFRGEAIPSIAAVSRFELITRRHDAPAATRVVLEGGRLVTVEEAGAPVGTQVTARSLFFNVPARRKFLRTVATELGHCLEAVTRQALIRPELDVTVTHDGNTPLRAPVVSDLAGRAADLLGPHGRALMPVAFRSGALSVEGLVSPVGVHRASARGSTYLYVNGRFVADPLLRRAVREAYRGIVPKGRHPTVVLSLRVPPDHVDVNVHPSKTEVRFQHGRELAGALSRGIRDGLEQHGIQQPVRPPPRPRAPDPGPAPSQGQLARTYLLCEGAGEMVIIDQHAAHERVTLHRLQRARRERLGGGQRLLTPALVELTAARAAALAPHTPLLARYGLEVEPFGGDSMVVKQVPEALTGADPQRLLEDVADDLSQGGDGRAADALVEHLLNTMACHTSVRAGQTLSPYEMRELLRSLDQVDFEVCAHGRPVCIRISPAELERRFHRS